MNEQYLGVGGRMVTVGGKAVKMPPGTGGANVPRDDLDLTDLGAVKIVLPESYSQNFDGTGTMTIRGMK